MSTLIRGVWDGAFDTMRRIRKTVGRIGTNERVVGNVDMDGWSTWLYTCLQVLASKMTFLLMEVVQREAIWWYNTLLVNIRIVFLERDLESVWILEKKGKLKYYKLSCPERHLLQPQLNVFIWLLRANVAPTVWTWMLSTLEFLLYNPQFIAINKICCSISVSLFLWSLNRLRILKQNKLLQHIIQNIREDLQGGWRA